jgi:hypothetical protein
MHHANESAKKFRLVLTFKTVAMKISPSHHLTISPSHHLTISPSHHLTISPSHHLTISPSDDSCIQGFVHLWISEACDARYVSYDYRIR